MSGGRFTAAGKPMIEAAVAAVVISSRGIAVDVVSSMDLSYLCGEVGGSLLVRPPTSRGCSFGRDGCILGTATGCPVDCLVVALFR